MQTILDKARQEFQKLISFLEQDLKTIKTGRAKPGLVEDIKVEAYNTQISLKELASISVVDPHQLIISPWDKSILKNVEKALVGSEIKLTVQVDKDVVRVIIPPLTEETRREMVKLVWQKVESYRRLLRQIRNEKKAEIESFEGQPGISEDDVKRKTEELQKLVEETLGRIEALGKEKETELMTI